MTLSDIAWPDEQVRQLLVLHDSGMPASRIAAALRTGKTRRAVLGKLHRLGRSKLRPLSVSEPKEKFKPPKPEQTMPSMPKTVSVSPVVARRRPLLWPSPPPPQTNNGRITVLDLTANTCRWPIGDPRAPDFTFCGQGPVAGGPYCAGHKRLSVDRTCARIGERRAAS